MNYAAVKLLPGFCYTCLAPHTEERHALKLAYKREYAGRRRQRLGPDFCPVCNDLHNPERHARYLTQKNGYYLQVVRPLKETTPGYCSQCQQRHDPQRHAQALRARRWQRWCPTCQGSHDTGRHARRRAAREVWREGLRSRLGDRYCGICQNLHDPVKHEEVNARYRSWYRRNHRPAPPRVRHRPQPAGPPPPEFYPYVLEGMPDPIPAMMQAVLAATKDLPEALRADVCQDMMVDIMSGNLAINDINFTLPKYRRKQFGDWAISLEKPITQDGRSLRDLL